MTAVGAAVRDADPPARRAGPTTAGRGADLALAAVLVAVAAALRAGPLGPSSLWLDDAWAALAARADGLGELRLTGSTAPGFALLERAVFGVVGFSETAAQAVPFLAGVLGPAALWLVARRRGLALPGALAAAGLLLAAPVHVLYSTRVKQYTVDALLVVALLGLAWWLLEKPGDRRRWAALTIGSAAAVAVSAAVAPVVAGAFAAGWFAVLRRARPAWRTALVASAAGGAVCLGWYLVVVRSSVSEGLRDYWAGSFLVSLDDVAPNVAHVLEALAPVPSGITAVVLGAAAVVLVVRRPELAVLFGVPVAVAVVLAVLELAPFGGGRTDTYLLPVLALAVGVAVDAMAGRRAGALAAVAAAVVASVVLVEPPSYTAEDVRPFVAAAERDAGPDDRVLVYSATRWAYALYTDGPVDLDPSSSPPGFRVAMGDGRVRVLGPWRDTPERYAGDVAAATAGADEVWLVASHWRDDLPAIEAALVAAGFERTEQAGRPGALLERWERLS